MNIRRNTIAHGMRSTFLSIILLCAIGLPARAQDLGGIIGVFGRVIEQDMRRKEEDRRARQQERQQEQRLQQMQDEAREQEIALIKRVQSALKRLGFYKAKVDGDRGPGTLSAERAFREAFGIQSYALDDSDVSQIEAMAALGFRNRDEQARAQRGGFETREDLVAAEAGQFTNAADFDEARRLGLSSFALYQKFLSSGFSSAQAFLVADKAGFSQQNEYDAARKAGFERQAEYQAFLASGLKTRAEFLSHVQRMAEAKQALGECLVGSQSGTPETGLEPCLKAISTGGSSGELRTAFEKLGQRLQERRARLIAGDLTSVSNKTASAESTLPKATTAPPSESAGAFLQTLAIVDEAIRRHECGTAVLLKDWEKAERECSSASDGEDQPALASLRRVAVEKAEEERAAKKKRDDEEKAAAQAEVNRLALETARSSAAALTKDLGDYSAAKYPLGNPIAVAKAVVVLKRQVATDDYQLIDQARMQLEKLLEDDAGFQTFVNSKRQAAKVAEVNARATTLAEMQRLEAFIESYVAANLMSDHVTALLDLQSLLAAARTSGNDQVAINSLADAKAQLQRLGVAQDLQKFISSASTDKTASDNISKADNGLAVTDGNRALLEGHAKDIVVLGNYSPTAPHLIVNLLGETTFDDGKASYCWLTGKPAAFNQLSATMKAIEEAGAETAQESEKCDLAGALNSDLVLLERGKFLQGDVLKARPFVEGFEDKQLRIISTVSWSDVGEQSLQGAAFSDQLVAEILGGSRRGFGVTAFKGGARKICMVVPAAELEAHWAVLDVKAKQILSPLTADQEAETMSLDRAFIGIQKLNCGAVYADHANLKLLIEGLQRAAIEFDVIPFWVESEEVDVELQRLADRQSENQKAIASRQQEIAAQAALDAEQASASEVVRAKAETELRQRFAQEANAAFGELSKTGEAFFRHSDSAPYSFTALFPQIAQRQAQLDAEGWELDQFNSAMIDYGTAEWKGRRAEVVFAEMRVRSKNRMRGEYAEDCFAVGYLIDAEFNLIRDPVESECGKFTGAISSWKTGRSFESRWIVN